MTTTKRFSVPVFDATLWLCVTDDVEKERRKKSHLFGPVEDGPKYDAMCSYNNRGAFALFFSRRSLSHKMVGHELFHLTHRIMDWVGANFDPCHHEQGALLHGYLADAVMKELRRQGVELR